MRLSDDPTRFTSQWKYVELARFKLHHETGKPMVSRYQDWSDKKNPKPILLPWDEVYDYAAKYKNHGIYTSVARYNGPSIDNKMKLSSLYFDIDHDDPGIARADMGVLLHYLTTVTSRDNIRVYFTGKKGFHIEVEALALGVAPSEDLSGLFRFIASDLVKQLELTTIDFQVYDERRMWRLPYTQHQGTGLWKNELTDKIIDSDIEEYCKEPHPIDVPVPEFDPKANQWYREYCYQYEVYLKGTQQSYSTEDLIERFNKYGTSIVKDYKGDGNRVFDPKKLFDNCHSIRELWEKAETEHTLAHEERLFLCSILTYTDQAVWYLHEILKNCHDYNPDISQSHIDDWVRRRELGIGGRPFSCRRANEAGVGCGNCDLEAKPKMVKIGDKLVETGDYSEPSPIRYAYSWQKSE